VENFPTHGSLLPPIETRVRITSSDRADALLSPLWVKASSLKVLWGALPDQSSANDQMREDVGAVVADASDAPISATPCSSAYFSPAPLLRATIARSQKIPAFGKGPAL
jgi:hypothetical protein